MVSAENLYPVRFTLLSNGGQAVIAFDESFILRAVEEHRPAINRIAEAPPYEPHSWMSVVEELLTDIRQSWHALIPVVCSEPNLCVYSDLLQFGAYQADVLIGAIVWESPHVSGSIYICYPRATIEPLLPALR